MSKKFTGLFFSISIAIIATSLSYIHPTFEALVISIILGMLFSNILEDRNILNEGVEVTIKFFLPVGIALYGLQLHVGRPDLKLVFPVVITYISIFASVYMVTQFFNIKKKTSILLATGMSTCGASAIAIVSPLINAESEETSISLLTIMVYGLMAMILYPVIGDLIGLNPMEFAFLTGTSLPMLGQVKVAASTCGNDCVNMAVKYKLIRISFLAFVITLSVLLSRERGKGFFIPWFVVAFLLLAVSVNIFNLEKLTRISGPVSRFTLSTALAAIGMKVDFDSVSEAGGKPVIATFLALILILIAMYITYSIMTI